MNCKSYTIGINNTDNNKKLLIEALEKSHGLVSFACKKVGISRTTFYEYIKKDENFKKEVESIEDNTGDFVENKLFELIEEKNVAAIIFYCKTKLKNRGYVERQELTGKDGKEFELPFIDINGRYRKKKND